MIRLEADCNAVAQSNVDHPNHGKFFAQERLERGDRGCPWVEKLEFLERWHGPMTELNWGDGRI